MSRCWVRARRGSRPRPSCADAGSTRWSSTARTASGPAGEGTTTGCTCTPRGSCPSCPVCACRGGTGDMSPGTTSSTTSSGTPPTTTLRTRLGTEVRRLDRADTGWQLQHRPRRPAGRPGGGRDRVQPHPGAARLARSGRLHGRAAARVGLPQRGAVLRPRRAGRRRGQHRRRDRRRPGRGRRPDGPARGADPAEHRAPARSAACRPRRSACWCGTSRRRWSTG